MEKHLRNLQRKRKSIDDQKKAQQVTAPKTYAGDASTTLSTGAKAFAKAVAPLRQAQGPRERQLFSPA